MNDYLSDSRFVGIEPFAEKVWLSSPTMHGEEKEWILDAFDKNWITTDGDNVRSIEKEIANKIGRKFAVGLSSGTAALHLATKLAAEKLYGRPSISHGSLENKRFFASDVTFDATLEGAIYEGGIPIFIDTEYDSWNMDPLALEKAFEMYPDVKIIVLAHLYGTPGKADEIRKIADKHGALIIEDAAESFGATINGIQTGCFGDYSAISFNGNKIITGSSGGMLLCDDEEDANKVRKWSTQSREDAPWYQHEELGYNYRMSNIIAGIVRGQLPHLDEHIEAKRDIYNRYKEGLKDLPVTMNPYLDNTNPNFWLSCLLIDEKAMCDHVRGELKAVFRSESGKSCPTEILEAISAFNAEGRPIWKPMHMQPLYRMHEFITINGTGRARSNAYILENGVSDVGADIFERGLCLPSDNKMTVDAQEKIIKIIHGCFL